MTNNYYNPYTRLQTYYTLLSNDAQSGLIIDEKYFLGISILHINEITKIPLKLIREDISQIYNWMGSLRFDDDSHEYIEVNEKYHLNDILEEDSFSSKIEELFIKGSLDEVPICLNIFGYMLYQLQLTSDEALALYSYIPEYENNMFKYERPYRIKDSYRFNQTYTDLNDYLDRINQAIINDKCLKMTYKTSKNEIISVVFKPLKIIYDSVENLYAVITLYKDQPTIYRLDRMISISISKEKLTIENTEFLSISPNVWGLNFLDTPEKVKVRFYNEGNVWKKVRRDLSYRTNGNLYEQDGYLYYEDIVYGISAFHTWIRGYGSSAVVLEPKSLRQQIIESLKYRKEHF